MTSSKSLKPIFFKKKSKRIYVLLSFLLLSALLLWIVSCSKKSGYTMNGKIKSPSPGVAAEELAKRIRGVQFDFDDTRLRDDARKILKEDATILIENPKISVSIEGHCDERGSSEYNLALGEKRAAAIQKFLVNLGIDQSRFSTVSYGEEKPLDPGHDEKAWSKNRRGALIVSTDG